MERRKRRRGGGEGPDWTNEEATAAAAHGPSHSRGCKQGNMESVDTQWSKKWSEITNPATVNEFT